MLRRRVLTRARRRVSMLSAVAVAVAALPALPPLVGAAEAAPVMVAADGDATVAAGDPGRNAGGTSTLGVDGSPETEAYIRFPAVSVTGTATRATLRLFVVEATKDAPAVHVVAAPWSESTITWNNRPSPAPGGPVADRGAAAAGTWLEYDVTTAVTGSAVGFALIPETGDGIDLSSREAPSNRPQLVVETGPATISRTFAPSADARVEEQFPATNFGSDPGLGNQGEPDPLIETYLRFDVAGLGAPVRRATLRLLVTGSGAGPTVRPTGSTWTESALSWANRPAPTGAPVGSFGSLSRGWAELDVTELVPGNGPVNLVLAGGSGDSVQVRSREGAPEERPQLVVGTGTPPASSSSTTVSTQAPPTTTSSTTTTTTGTGVRCDNRWADSRKVGELPHGRAEMSGLAASTAYPGWGWGIRDSLNPAALYSFRIGGGGTIAADEFLVPGAANHDWEDVVYTPGPGGVGNLWVLDNINNAFGGTRDIYQVAEPDPAQPGPAELIRKYNWVYPDAQYNTEVLFLFDGDLAVVSKTSPSRVYRFLEPLKPGVLNKPTFVGLLPTGSNLSVAGVSPDNRFMAVASHSRLYVYENDGTLADLGDMIANPPVFSESLPSDNREAGGFFPAGSCDIVLVSESKNVWRSSQ